jgi:hypothetical protein
MTRNLFQAIKNFAKTVWPESTIERFTTIDLDREVYQGYDSFDNELPGS